MTLFYQIGLGLFKFFTSLFFSLRVIHPERMIQHGPCIIAMNHQSFLDPPIAGVACNRVVYTLARDSLFKWPIAGKLFPLINVMPLDRSGNDMKAIKLAVRLIKEGKALLMFPEGTRSPDGNLQPAQPGIGFIIGKTLVPVVPMRVFGAADAMPKSGQKFQASPVRVVIGEPVYFTEADLQGGRDLYQRLSDRVMEAIAAIKDPGDRDYGW